MRLNEMQQRVNDNSALVHRGRFVTLTFTLGIGKTDYLVDIAAGKIANIRQRRLPTDSGVFAIRANSDSWRRHWQPIPRATITIFLQCWLRIIYRSTGN